MRVARAWRLSWRQGDIMSSWALITALSICPGVHYGDEYLDVYFAACPGLTVEACSDSEHSGQTSPDRKNT